MELHLYVVKKTGNCSSKKGITQSLCVKKSWDQATKPFDGMVDALLTVIKRWAL
jgi:hypothetical protein